ncbi:MAG: sigma 54-interacting transcriptional regulator, partial [Myxococcales bacterium]|nr:sigma 54-interacting transcriptional regulator [Myxococcales bacterium]
MTDRRSTLRLVDQTSSGQTTETEGLLVAPAEEAMIRASLTIIHHPSWDLVGLHAPVQNRGSLLGRSPRSCLPGVFDVPKVSRDHAEVRIERGAVVVVDLDSRNGTKVNGEPIERKVLAPGDVVELGGILMMLTLGPASYPEPHHPRILGHSWALAQLLADLERAAKSEHAVTLVGETGTGKELAAEAIHEQSQRAGGPMVAINCSALSEGLIESELFGHEQGAFTGAGGARDGLVAHAEGGTLFL